MLGLVSLACAFKVVSTKSIKCHRPGNAGKTPGAFGCDRKTTEHCHRYTKGRGLDRKSTKDDQNDDLKNLFGTFHFQFVHPLHLHQLALISAGTLQQYLHKREEKRGVVKIGDKIRS